MMDSAAMPLEPEQSSISLPVSDKAMLGIGAPDFNGIKSIEQLTGHGFAPKVRKPYTITKQRERWTDDEHKKFMEALKLYGRAWRKIEEHVGTKTAVQIRSHAQKFFSKVVRESKCGADGSEKPIEIPPPRPKRKPMHPYPRKLSSVAKTGVTIPEKQTSLASPKYSEQDNQSPTSVLSTMGSDSSVGPESCIPAGSPSSAGTGCGSVAPNLISEGAISSRPNCQDENWSCVEHVIPLELDISSQNNVFVKENPNESAAQSLKLFGKTLLLMDPQETCKTDLFEPLKFPVDDSEYNIQINPFYTQTDTSPPVPLPWLTLCSNVSRSSTGVHSPTPIKARPSHVLQEKHNDEGSTADSNTSIERKEETKSFPSCKLTLNRRKGFAPYKRCFSEQEKTSEEREQQRIRLCL